MGSFTGNPFVDAGIAGMCAAAEVDSPAQLGKGAVRQAVETLYRVLLSDSAFKQQPPYKCFATSTMAMIFPNSPLPQASYPQNDTKREKYRERIDGLLEHLDAPSDPTSDTCFACGQPTNLRFGKDQFPLMGSVDLVNFHPNLGAGHSVCAFCALAVQFLPFSLLQTKAEGGRLWFLHSMDPALAVLIPRKIVLPQLAAQVAAGEALRFPGQWACSGENGAVLSLLHEIGKRFADVFEQVESPVSVYLFSNDNREQFLHRVPVPRRLLLFFNALQAYPQAREQFEQELLPKGNRIAEPMLHTLKLIHLCLDNDAPKLLGGWQFHRLYLEEVMQMTKAYIHALEEVARRIVAHEDSKRYVNDLRLATHRAVMGVLIDLVRDGLMMRQELHILTPPGEVSAAADARDYLLGAIYALQNGEQLQPEPSGQALQEKHPLIERIETSGQRVIDAHQDEAKRLREALRQASSPRDIRRAFLRLVEQAQLGWQDFLFFCPPADADQHFQSRDYWLAFLYDTMREETTEQQSAETITP